MRIQMPHSTKLKVLLRLIPVNSIPPLRPWIVEFPAAREQNEEVNPLHLGRVVPDGPLDLDELVKLALWVEVVRQHNLLTVLDHAVARETLD